MTAFGKILKFIKKPPIYVHIITYILTLLSVIGSLLCLLIMNNSNLLLIFSCTVFTLAMLGIIYTTYIIISSRKFYRILLVQILSKFSFTRFILDHFGYRKFVYMIWSFLLTIGYVSINIFLGVAFTSIWYYSLAAYNFFLLLMRGSILMYHNNRRKNKSRTINEDKLYQAKTYLTCGILLSVLNIALSIAISEIIFHDMHYNYYSWTIYAYAAFTFYKITMAIYRKIRYRKDTDLTERAARSFNLAGACFSVMGLQTTLLAYFTTTDINIKLFNTITGLSVSIITITLSIIMVFNGIKRYKRYRSLSLND